MSLSPVLFGGRHAVVLCFPPHNSSGVKQGLKHFSDVDHVNTKVALKERVPHPSAVFAFFSKK